MKEKLVVVGNGMAGMRTVEELLKLAPENYDITVFGAEPHGELQPHPAVAGAGRREDVRRHHAERRRLVCRPRHHPAHGQEGRRHRPRASVVVEPRTAPRPRYDRLLLATGSNPFILPVPGKDLPGVIGFRDIADVETHARGGRSNTATRW